MEIKETKNQLLLINEKLDAYISCADDNQSASLKVDIEILLYEYFMKEVSGRQLNSMFSKVYVNAVNAALEEVKNKGIKKHKNEEWFITIVKKYVNKQYQETKTMLSNQSNSSISRRNYIDKLMVALYEKYAFPLAKRPGNDQTKNDGLKVDLVEKKLREEFSKRSDIPEAVVEHEIASIINVIENTHATYDYTESAEVGEDDVQVSMADKVNISENDRDALDARRFIKCAQCFYDEIKEVFNGFDADVRNAKRYMTFRMFVARPTDLFVKYVLEDSKENVVDKDWLQYLKERSANLDETSKLVGFDELLLDYATQRRPEEKLKKGSISNCRYQFEKLLKIMQTKERFSSLRY